MAEIQLCSNDRNSTIVFQGPTSKSQQPGRTPTSQHHGRISTLWQRIPFSAPIAEAQLSACIVHSQLPTSTVCLNGRKPNCLSTWPKVNSQLTFSKSSNSQDHRFRAWRHSHSSFISYLGFIMTIVIAISFARERKLYPMLFTWTKNRIVQSPTKLNDKI